jgi:RNA polymerase-binding transcription factor DksA
MTKTELKTFETTLRALQSRLRGDVSHLTSEALHGTSGGGHATTFLQPAEMGNDNFEQEFTLSLVQNQELVLEEIGSALERLHQGSFGRCEECQQVIKKARLLALPYTRHCVECARKLQQSS